jgi:hypothetical protein
MDDGEVACHRLLLLPDEAALRALVPGRQQHAVADGLEGLVDRHRDPIAGLVGRLVVDRVPGGGAHGLAQRVGNVLVGEPAQRQEIRVVRGRVVDPFGRACVVHLDREPLALGDLPGRLDAQLAILAAEQGTPAVDRDPADLETGEVEREACELRRGPDREDRLAVLDPLLVGVDRQRQVIVLDVLALPCHLVPG